MRRGRRNIDVATPKPCGTHLLIDIVLNNLPAYRNRPLYIDLDKAWQYRELGDRIFDRIDPQVGYVIKTHLPIQQPAATRDDRVLRLFEEAAVLTVHRDIAAMERSTARWGISARAPTAADAVRADYERFWCFWGDRPRIALEFGDLFRPDRMEAVLTELAETTGTARKRRYCAPIDRSRQRLIYANKALTRLLGRHAPRVDTTIHTLKTGR